MRFTIILFTLAAIRAYSHPVSFKDAFSIMSYNNSEMNEILLTYSLSSKFALGTTYINEKQSEFYMPRLNLLVKRWNNEDSQGNFYLSGGLGVEKYKSKNYDVRMVETIADWESRKYYIYLENLYMSRDNKDNPLWTQKNDNHTKLRLGFAPFLADYHDLNIWFITQFTKHNNENTEATQLIRFYIKNVLWEIGSGFNGGFTFNFMIHI